MAKKKITKKQQKQIEKMAKKRPVLFVIILLLVASIGLCVFLHWKRIIHIPFLDKIIPQQQETLDAEGGAFTEADIAEMKSSDVSIHFLELGNKYTGDCTLIKVGDTEVLIDAGSKKGSAETIKSYVDTFCTDGTLEYVIATHAHEDHIAGFVGDKKANTRTGIFYQFDIETLIQFPKSGQPTTTNSGNISLYGEYLQAVEYLEGRGTTVYTALECWNGVNGAQRSYTLGDGITMNFLYQKFYEESTSDENDYSVCMLLTETYDGGVNNYLFTGDLEKDGEASLVACKENNLPKCKLFKGGHHGSKTSSTDALLSVIKPDIVCVCCCAGSNQYGANPENTFPTQAFVDRVSKYTPNVYVTSLANDTEKGYEAMNGNIVIYSQNGTVNVRCSNNGTLLKDTDWFKKNRTMPSKWAS